MTITPDREEDVEMLSQIHHYLGRITPPDPDDLYSVAMVDPSADPVELYRQGLAQGDGNIWYVCTEKYATAITGNGPRARENAEFYAAAPTLIRWLLERYENLRGTRVNQANVIEAYRAETDSLRRQLAEAQAQQVQRDAAQVADAEDYPPPP